jgi:hypothetical protein
MTPVSSQDRHVHGDISWLRRQIRRGKRRIRQIVTWNGRRRRRIKRLQEMAPPLFGIDFAWGQIESGVLHDAAVRFVCRYLSNDASKNLSRAEAERYAKASIDTVVVWETTAGRALEGHDAGVVDARTAASLAAACGKPPGRPIYFAVDQDVTWPQVQAYFKGVASVLGRHLTGAYGGIKVISGGFDTGTIDYGWQTYAWSNGAWDHRAQLRQYSNGHTLAGVGVDYDHSTTVDFGQWRPA